MFKTLYAKFARPPEQLALQTKRNHEASMRRSHLAHSDSFFRVPTGTVSNTTELVSLELLAILARSRASEFRVYRGSHMAVTQLKTLHTDDIDISIPVRG